MPAQITTTINGTPDGPGEARTFARLIALENERRAALTPPGTPLPARTATELKASMKVILDAQYIPAWLASWVGETLALDFREEKTKRDWEAAIATASDTERLAAYQILNPPRP
jgi:hypothetical protein